MKTVLLEYYSVRTYSFYMSLICPDLSKLLKVGGWWLRFLVPKSGDGWVVGVCTLGMG